MCDDLTATDDERALERRGLSRREFAAIGAAAALASYAASVAAAVVGAGLTEAKVRVKTPDGSADAFFVHPSAGAHPGIVLWPDIAGLRDVFMMMARRLAAQGFAVLAVNHYYRSASAPVTTGFAEWLTPAGKARLQPMIAAITPEATTRDAKAFVAFLDAQPSVDKARRIGTHGYCMGGPYTVRTAAAVPARVGAAASLHGANLVSDDPASPAKLIAATRAAFLFAIARNDDARAPGDKAALSAACAAARRHAEIEVYAADHGWTVADTPAYDAALAEKAWGRMSALFATL